MTILTFLWRFTIGGAWKWLAAAGAAVLSIAGIYLKGRSDAKAKADGKALDATIKGNEAARKGRVEAADALRNGKTPEEIVRGNDDAWR